MSNHELTMFCPHCQKHTSLQMAKAEYRDQYNRMSTTAALWEKDDGIKWWIGICNSCHEPVLILNRCQVIYPTSMPSPTDVRIPEPMRTDLIEAKTCFSVAAYRGCAVLARRAMQTTCIEKGAKKGELKSQLVELKSNGTITKDLHEWADVVRWVGNDAAHPNKDQVTKDDAEDILKLSEQFLHVIYVAPAIALHQRTKKGK
jgi:hypothetical protein